MLRLLSLRAPSEAPPDRCFVSGKRTQQRGRWRRRRHRWRCDLRSADSAIAAGDTARWAGSTIRRRRPSDCLWTATSRTPWRDAHRAGRDGHRYTLPDQLPRHRVAVGVDLDGAIVADDTAQFAQRTERRPPAERLQPSSRAKRTIGASPVVPWIRTLATSRSHLARCASNASQLAKQCPAIAFFFT